ncbi:phosphate acetyltransferase [Botrimarina hoheduenensis]|uniref:Phosphate acetyltransferase n=1 Tax=Botrimarina hoheduenensis TaxID=2528000 RepID=A0A5C5W9B2_9BACT|nr:phosphate acetyltransferase [Botrimarina hoheduenensis]TWT47468.1 Phosphate acetyltransferase [Botrimarina hoheduenensis]
MSTAAYVLAWEPRSGKSLVVLGLMELLSRRVERLAYFRPLVAGDPEADPHLRLVRDRYRIETPLEQMVGVSLDRAEQLVAEGHEDELFKEVLARFRTLARHSDFVVCEGTDYTGAQAAMEFEFNMRLAVHLGCPAVVVGSGRGKSAREIVRSARAGLASFAEHGDAVAATFLNRVPIDQVDSLRTELERASLADGPVVLIPEEPSLARPTLDQVARGIGARWLHDPGDAAQRDVATCLVAAMTLPNFLPRMGDHSLVITPGDRADILLGATASHVAAGLPSVAGVLLTGGIELPPSIQQLVEGLRQHLPPLLMVDCDTYNAATAVEAVKPVLEAENSAKIAAALGAFERHVDSEQLARRIAVTRSERVTPLMFEYDLIERARRDQRRIVLPEGDDDRILRAAAVLLRRQVAALTLLGNPETILARAAALGLDLSKAQLIDPSTAAQRDEFAEELHRLRRHKGLTIEAAHDLAGEANYFGTMMVQQGDADGMVSGAAHTTAHTIRPALEVIRTREGCSIVSSVFLMCLADRVLVYGDCAVNPDPNPEQLADIAISSAETARRFGVEPRVAMLSYSTGESGHGAMVDKVREATRLVRQRAPELSIEGPIQYDAAIDTSVARAKLPGSTVAGQATVFVFPDLDSGNNTYKAVQRSANAVAIGPVLQGLRKPVNDLSRGCTVVDIVNTVAITAIQAQPTDDLNQDGDIAR